MTVTLRDDPKLDPLLERAKEGIVPGRGANGRELTDELLDDDGEYMEDSYDDVNLLSALAPISSVALHLPFSRLPPSYLPPLPPPSLPAPPRASSVSHTRTLSAGSSTGVAPDELHHPSLRRSIRRVLPIRPALQLEFRTVLCPVGALGLPVARTDIDADDEAGVLLCVEARGPPRASSSAPSEQEAFDIEHIDVLVEGAASASPAAGFGSGSGSGAGGPVGAAVSDIDVRAVALDRLPWPVHVTGGTGGEQHNFVYALAGVAAPAVGAASAHLPLIRHVDGEGDGHQRFAARFGAEEAVTGAGAGLLGPVRQGGRRGSQAPVAGKEGDPRWLRDVTVVVRGRPVVHRQKGATAGYSVPDATDAEETGEDESPTPAFLSRWQ
ncbi:hypothetical protein JCM3770_002899 [Rhodotorula araucariae]